MGNEQRLKTLAAIFLKNASSQLADGSTWLHEHHDEMLNKDHLDLSVEDLVGLMHAACTNDEYDANLYCLATHIPLPDSKGLDLQYPNDLNSAIYQNIQQGEPPSLNLYTRKNLFHDMRGFKHQYRVLYESDQTPQELSCCGVVFSYITHPFSDTYPASPSDPPDPTWSRSVSMMHCPELQ